MTGFKVKCHICSKQVELDASGRIVEHKNRHIAMRCAASGTKPV